MTEPERTTIPVVAPKGHGLVPACEVVLRARFVRTMPGAVHERDALRRLVEIELPGGQTVTLRLGDLEAVLP